MPNLRSWLSKKRRLLRGLYLRPHIAQPQGTLELGSTDNTFVVICGPTFNQSIPNAGTTARMGWCHGFEQIGVPYVLVSIFDLARRLPDLTGPLCWISASDYEYLDRANFDALKKCRHIVWVNTWFPNEAKFYERNKFPNNSLSENVNRKILLSEPELVFTISPTCSFDYYSLWVKHGARLVSLPLACDTLLYYPDPAWCSEFSDVKMAFVGGYWGYKAMQFDRYLKPYADQLKVFGYSTWPYAGYGGQLPVSKEPSLYRQARLSPTINEPHVEMMGVDQNERVFKVLGSGGMTITDATTTYREWFTRDELLVPENISEYHDMVRLALNDDGFNHRQRESGRRAIQERHTYAHRAREVLKYLNITVDKVV